METVKFTANEIVVLKAIHETGHRECGPLQYIIENLVKNTGQSVNVIKGILSSLRKKDIIYTYAGEYAFDGEIREDAEELFNSVINNAISENDKTENSVENQENPMMDKRIVRLNQIIATTLSSVSKNKRESVRANKTAAKFILEHWDNAEALIMLTFNPDMQIKCYELYCIAKSRVEQLTPKPEISTKEVTKNNDVATSEQAAETTETSNAVENTPKKRTTKSKHKVGDLHPTNDWAWTEYAPGKFDWRTNKHDNPEKSIVRSENAIWEQISLKTRKEG